MDKIWQSSILVLLSLFTAYMPAFACTALPLPEFDRVDTVFWDAASDPVTDQQFPGELIGKVIFVERSSFQLFFSSNKGKHKAMVLESQTHPHLVGKDLLIIQPRQYDGGGLCPPSEPGKKIGPSIGAHGLVRGSLGPSITDPKGIGLIYYSYKVENLEGEQ